MFSKGLFQPSNSKNCFRKMEFNLTKIRMVCILNRNIVKILFHFLHSSHNMGEFKRSSQVIFSEIYNFTTWVINFKGRFRGIWDDFGENKTWVLLVTCLIEETSPIFHTYITIRDMKKELCCNCFYF